MKKKIDRAKETFKCSDEEALKYIVTADFVAFIEYFFYIKNGEKFYIPPAAKDRNHFWIITKELMDFYNQKSMLLNINIPPSFGKTTLMLYFIAWCFAREPSCRFLYTAYGTNFAATKSMIVRDILLLPEYIHLFGPRIKGAKVSKTDFTMEHNGSFIARGFEAGITGNHAGSLTSAGFRGCLIIDDSIKTSDARSDTIRAKVNETYYRVIFSRGAGQMLPIVNISQRVADDDIVSVFKGEEPRRIWRHVVLPARWEDGSLLDPKRITHDQLDALLEHDPHTYWLQYMQQSLPEEYLLFCRKDFRSMQFEPSEVKFIFLTGDLAETDNTNNDASAFTAWAFCKRRHANNLEVSYLLLLDCLEVWENFNDLLTTFYSFYGKIENVYGKIKTVHVEDKSLGNAFISMLRLQPGISVKPIKRKSNVSKLDRIQAIQPYLKNGKVFMIQGNACNEKVIQHMCRITRAKSRVLDDIADTVSDAVDIAFNSKKQREKYKLFEADTLGSFKSNRRSHGEYFYQ